MYYIKLNILSKYVIIILMEQIIFYLLSLVFLILIVMYIIKQIIISRELSLKDTTLENLEEELKKHKLIGGRHKRTNKKNPPII